MVSIRDYAKMNNVSYEAIRQQVKRYEDELNGHVIEDITNRTIQGNHDITVHGIEIKISKGDLLNDTKMQEYADYCDYFWLAIPEELTEDAIDYVLDDWGILVYHRNKDGSGELQSFQKPKKLNATMREYALVEAIKRNLK